jgi:aminopeptidase N
MNAFPSRKSASMRLPFLSVPLAFATLLLLGSCSSAGRKPEESSGPTTTVAGAHAGKSSVLTREMAMVRSRQVHKIHYDVWLGASPESLEFQGKTKISFDVRDNAFQRAKKLRIDFTGGQIQSVSLDGAAWTAEKIAGRYDGERLELDRDEVPKGRHVIEIGYSHLFSESGNGFYRFKDPEDGKVYLRSDLEPYYANLIFPCFDQPDLKANFDLVFDTPEDWTVVSNTPVKEKAQALGARKAWKFATSPVMSTYLFAVAAGPWKEWKADHDGTPLGLYARQSVAKYVDAAEWFKVAGKGLEFYDEFFGVPYPYGKYDQILIPDMNAGAMENIGAVTFSESFIYRGTPTEEQRKDRADTILHEMAHMWFGDLVTMRWWNGLWLNESFATYMASVAMDRTKLFTGAPQTFFSDMKRWAYGEDQMPTTHPIEVSVPDTDQASANFDGITYGKGASALKQLHFLLGDDDFQEGLHRYFTKFANRNTALADFMNAMGQSSDRNLSGWTKSWLQSTGYSTVSVDLACEEEEGEQRISRLDLSQKSPGKGNTLRPHQFLVGLYYQDKSGKLVRHDEGYQVSLEGEKVSVEAAVGKKCPDLFFPNEQDYGYFATDLDPKSLATAQTSLTKIQDPFTRHLLVFTLREMVKSGSWKIDAFAEAALEWLKSETNTTLLQDLSDMLASPRNGGMSAIRILDGDKRADYRKRLHALARKKAETAAPGSGIQRTWFELALRTLSNDASADWALSVRAKKAKVSGLKLDPDLRWNILEAVARVRTIDEKTLESAAKDDASSEGKTRLLQVRAAMPEPGTAVDLPAYFAMEKTPDKNDPSLTTAMVRKAMKTYLTLDNPARTEAWRPKFFASLESVGAKADDSYYVAYVRSLFPSLCRDDVAAEARAWIAAHPKSDKGLRIALEKMAFGEGWCAAIREGRPYPLWAEEAPKK